MKRTGTGKDVHPTPVISWRTFILCDDSNDCREARIDDYDKRHAPAHLATAASSMNARQTESSLPTLRPFCDCATVRKGNMRIRNGRSNSCSILPCLESLRRQVLQNPPEPQQPSLTPPHLCLMIFVDEEPMRPSPQQKLIQGTKSSSSPIPPPALDPLPMTQEGVVAVYYRKEVISDGSDSSRTSPLLQGSQNSEEREEACSTLFPPHSCCPTAELQCNKDNTLRVVGATVDHNTNTAVDITISRLPRDILDRSVEERDTWMQANWGHSCTCVRCRYELLLSSSSSLSDDFLQGQGNIDQALVLAQWYFGQREHKHARVLYEMLWNELETRSTAATSDKLAPTQLQNTTTLLAVGHALAALDISQYQQPRFLRAQRRWQQLRQLYERIPGMREQGGDDSLQVALCPGLEIQWAKLEAYGYLEDPSISAASLDEEHDTKGETGFRQAFPSQPVIVTRSFLTEEECQQVIVMAADAAQWTTGRHYAVPTRDVAVHSVSVLLEWWKTRFFPRLQHLLKRQFDNNGDDGWHYYCHDAFVVRYKAGEYLPIHTDESTHSLVLALNSSTDAGTYFAPPIDDSISLAVGDLLTFRGDELSHGGCYAKDERYILAAFLYRDRVEKKKRKAAATRAKTSLPLPSIASQTKRYLVDAKSSNFSFDFTV